MFRVTVSVALLVTAPLVVADPPTAIKTLGELRQNLARDKEQQDWKAYLADAHRLNTFLNGSPDGVLELSRAYLQIGNSPRALIEAQAFVAMGQVHPLLESTQFQPLHASLEAQIQRNQSEISMGRQAFALSDAGLVPEDIDYDTKTRQFFVTSIL